MTRRMRARAFSVRLRRAILQSASLLLTCCMTSAASAGDALRLTHPGFAEILNPAFQGTSGPETVSTVRGIAGLQFGLGTGAFDIDGIEIGLPTDSGAKAYCVRVATNDGLYRASNDYAPDAKAGDVGTIETRSSYAHQLKATYKADQVVVRIVANVSCAGDPVGLLVPAVPPGGRREGPLVVFLNAPDGHADVRLADGAGRGIADAACRDVPASTSVTYTEQCEIPLTDSIAHTARKLLVVKLGQHSIQTYPVFIK